LIDLIAHLLPLLGRNGPHVFNDSFVFHSDSSSWSSLGRCPARAGHCVVSFDSWLVLFGGIDETGFRNDLLARDMPAVLSQSRGTTQKAKRKHKKDAAVNKWASVSLRLATLSSSSATSTSSSSSCCSSSAGVPDARFGHSLTAVPAGNASSSSRLDSFLLFGGMNATTDLSDMWLLTLSQL